jgi:hypothetical protein
MAQPTEYAAGLEAIKRRRAIADAMQAQAFSPLSAPVSGTGSYPIQTRVQPLQVLAQLGQAFVARKQNQKADKEYAEIAKAMGSDRSRALEALTKPDMGPSYQPDPSADESQGPTRMIQQPQSRAGGPSPQAMQAAIDAGIDPSVISSLNKQDEAYTLAPGARRFQGNREIASVPANDKENAAPSDVREYEYARNQGYKGSFQDYQVEMKRAGAASVNVNTEKLPTPPQGMAYVKDPSSPFGYRLQKIPGARDQRTEGQQKAGLLAKRMNELSGDVIDRAPSVTDQQAANFAQKGGIVGAMANGMLGEKQQRHFNAARGWLAGILRQDTGATISPAEVEQYYPTYFPVPGDSTEVIAQKKRLRQVTEAGLTQIGGDEQTPAPPAGDLDARVQSYYETPNGQ